MDHSLIYEKKDKFTHNIKKINLTISLLLKAGVHLGTTSQEYYPLMNYVVGFRHNIYIIDLTQTMFLLKKALYFLLLVMHKRGRVCITGNSVPYIKKLFYYDFIKNKKPNYILKPTSLEENLISSSHPLFNSNKKFYLHFKIMSINKNNEEIQSSILIIKKVKKINYFNSNKLLNTLFNKKLRINKTIKYSKRILTSNLIKIIKLDKKNNRNKIFIGNLLLLIRNNQTKNNLKFLKYCFLKAIKEYKNLKISKKIFPKKKLLTLLLIEERGRGKKTIINKMRLKTLKRKFFKFKFLKEEKENSSLVYDKFKKRYQIPSLFYRIGSFEPNLKKFSWYKFNKYYGRKFPERKYVTFRSVKTKLFTKRPLFRIIKFLKRRFRKKTYKYRKRTIHTVRRKYRALRARKTDYRRWCTLLPFWFRGALTNQRQLYIYRKKLLKKFIKLFKIKQLKEEQPVRLNLTFEEEEEEKLFKLNYMNSYLQVKRLAGINCMSTIILILDCKDFGYAANEALIRKVPSIAILSTNMRPSEVTYPIPGNAQGRNGIHLYSDLIYLTIKCGAKLSQYF